MESGPGFGHLTSIAASQGVEVVRVHDIPLHKMAASLGRHFPSPRGSRYQFKTIQVNEDKRTSVGSSLARSLSFPKILISVWSAWEALLALRGNPHLDCRVIHVGGDQWQRLYHCYLVPTLEAGRFTVGVFTSPYLIHYNDQITINGEAISDQDLQTYLDSYQQLLQAKQSKAVFQGLTEFEVMTAIAYDYFAHEELDYVIMEVGMGGTTDSTNVCQPVLTAITSIGLDHVALLGPDLASIAREKAGIIKPGIPLVLGKLEAEASQVIEGIAIRSRYR